MSSRVYATPKGRVASAHLNGHAYTRFPFKHMEDFRVAERTAREGKLGLWGPGN